MKFCGNCGAKLVEKGAGKFESLAFLHFTGSSYLFVTLIFNALVRSFLTLVISYLIAALLGLYAGYQFYNGKIGRWLKVISAISISVGFGCTFILFIIGLGVRGVIGPAFLIFLINALLLWTDSTRL